MKPKLSVCLITYNQKKYIKQALMNAINQKTNFSFEIIVSDDHSTDGTAAILTEFKKKYPDKIKLILNKKNLGGPANFIKTFRFCKGKYIALLEGDDYWTTEDKLQTQVDFLDNNPDYSICFHPVKVVFENGKEKDSIYPPPGVFPEFSIEELLKANFIQTSSVVYRMQDNSKLSHRIFSPADWYLHLFHAKFGKIKSIENVMSVYRRHDKGIWWESYGNPTVIYKKYGTGFFLIFTEAYKLFGHEEKYRKIILEKVFSLLNVLGAVDNASEKPVLISNIVTNYPQELSLMLNGLTSEMYGNTSVKDAISLHESMSNCVLRDAHHLENQLNAIKTAKFYKIWQIYCRIRNKFIAIVPGK